MLIATFRALLAGAVISASLFAPLHAAASNLLAPAMDAKDQATLGTRIADPQTPAAALFANPAGLTQFDTKTLSASFGVAYGKNNLDASSTVGYVGSDEIFPLIPAIGLAVPLGDDLVFGTGLYGSTGSIFEFEADAAAGVDEFFSETIIMEIPVALAYRVSEDISVGAEISALFGQLRTHFMAMGTDFKYKLNSPGVQGAVGASWRATDELSFGLGVRTPGIIWMDGTMPVPGLGTQNVEVDLQMPAQVFLGTTYKCSPRLTLSSSVRFSDTSSFGESIIQYELTPAANIGFVPDARDEWKFAIGAEYQLRDDLWLRLGAMHASHIVGASGVSPLVYDADDTKLAAGFGRDFGTWEFNAAVGYALPDGRSISPTTALVLPGEYRQRGGIIVVGFTRSFSPND